MYNICINIDIYTYTYPKKSMFVYEFMSLRTYICTYLHIKLYARVHMCVRACVCVCVRVYARSRMCVCVCVCVHV